MKRTLLLVVVIIIFAVVTGNAFAGNTRSGVVGISATVTSNCTPISVGNLSFAVDPSITTGEVDSTGAQPTTVQCSNTGNPVYTVTATSAGSGNSDNSTGVLIGTLKSASTPADTIAYTLYFNYTFPGQGFGVGKDITIITAAGSSSSQTGAVISVAAAQAAVVHNDYADTVTLTIAF